MTNVLGFLLALWLSFAMVWMPRGMAPSMPEFWLTSWLYGAPLIVLAWPLYLTLFRRLRRQPWWMLAIVGFVLSPIPFYLLIVATAMIQRRLPTGYSSSYYVPWNSVFTTWYAVFGVLFGIWVGLTRDNRVYRPEVGP
jgi:hypothetical protein